MSLFSKKKVANSSGHSRASIESQEHAGAVWIDAQNPTIHELEEIARTFNLHSVQVHQSLQGGQIAQMDIEDDHIFLILHFPYLLPNENKISTGQVSIFLGKNHLITVHDSTTPTVRKLFRQYRDDDARDTGSPGRILFHLIETMLRDVQTLTQGVSLELDEIEDNVFDVRTSDAFQIGELRQKIMRLRRTLATQKNVLDQLDAVIDQFTDEKLEVYYESNTNMSRRLWQTVEEARETIEIYKDADFTTSTEQTNKILAILTLLFTLSIPATILGAFYGMNVLIPGGLEAGSWTFLGPYTTFKLIIGTSILAAVLMYLYFRHKRWF